MAQKFKDWLFDGGSFSRNCYLGAYLALIWLFFSLSIDFYFGGFGFVTVLSYKALYLFHVLFVFIDTSLWSFVFFCMFMNASCLIKKHWKTHIVVWVSGLPTVTAGKSWIQHLINWLKLEQHREQYFTHSWMKPEMCVFPHIFIESEPWIEHIFDKLADIGTTQRIILHPLLVETWHLYLFPNTSIERTIVHPKG